MEFRAMLGGVLLAMLATTPGFATVRIANDPGGQIGPYLEKLNSIRSSGENVVIDGPCLSACTMVLGIIPRDRICVTPRAQLGFHAAWNPGSGGRRIVSIAGTEVLWDIYPQHIRRWIAQRGGLSPKMKYLSGRELAAMYPTCR
ncbi:MAG TPA: hypothetical protein VHA55_13210 [Pseudorhodoplanes sp.]|jgi:hypothetical protein|nr:hypothetical protein [Pseudorhodoplanes sp.]